MRGPAVAIDRIVREVLAEMCANPCAARQGKLIRSSANGKTASAACEPARHPPSSPPCSGVNSRVVISFSDLEGRLDGRGEWVVPQNAIITPLARDYLKQCGVALRNGSAEQQPRDTPLQANQKTAASRWVYAVLACSGPAEGAVQAIVRQGTALSPIAARDPADAIRACAGGLANGTVCGALLFCDDAALVACAANKRTGVRASVAESPSQVARAMRSLAANVLVIEPSGKTLHELRNIVRAFCHAKAARRPPQQTVELLGEG